MTRSVRNYRSICVIEIEEVFVASVLCEQASFNCLKIDSLILRFQ
jgi:hypothetical protein